MLAQTWPFCVIVGGSFEFSKYKAIRLTKIKNVLQVERCGSIMKQQNYNCIAKINTSE